MQKEQNDSCVLGEIQLGVGNTFRASPRAGIEPMLLQIGHVYRWIFLTLECSQNDTIFEIA